MYSEIVKRAELGPFDVSEVGSLENIIDFGAIKLPNVNRNLSIKVELEEDTRRLVALTLQTETSMLQVSLFSAPKNSTVWQEVLEVLTTSLESQSAQVTPVVGSFGRELMVAMQVPNLEGGSALQHIRFIGVDGPRWLLRGSITGDALSNLTEQAEIERIYRSIVVDRGAEALPPRELVPLTMPPGNIAPPARPQ
ncbi:MAG: hypothetical protein RI974_540 [Actinomycetota bacterium]